MIPPMSHSNPVSGGTISGQPKGHLAIVPLDSLASNRQLVPNQPLLLAPGVVISVLQSASEALIEVEEAAVGKIFIDDKSTSELATVRPGQVIKVSNSRYALMKSMQAMIVPRDEGYRRPEHVQKIIDLATASVGEGDKPSGKSSDQSELTPNLLAKWTPKVSAVGETVKSMIDVHKESKTISIKLNARTGIMLLAVGMIGYWLVFGASGEKTATVPQRNVKASSDFKSTIAPVSGKTDDTMKPLEDEAKVAKAESPAKIEALKEAKKDSAIDALKAALKSNDKGPSIKKSGKSGFVSEKTKVDSSVRGVKLSSKDRQLVLEYRLEARFDRAKARTKMKELKESYPVGSSARAEIEQAYGSM